MVVRDSDDVSGPQQESGELGEGEQPTPLVKAELRDLFHIGCKNAGFVVTICYVLLRNHTVLIYYAHAL